MKDLKDNKPEFLIIHHSWSPDNPKWDDWEGIRKYHMSYRLNGVILSPEKAKMLMGAGTQGIEIPWADIGYNYGIEFVSGVPLLQVGRPEATHGAHCQEERMNYKSLGVCVVGNFDKQPPAKAVFDLLVDLCATKCRSWSIPVEKVKPHRDYALEINGKPYKTCPGLCFPMDELKAKVKELIG